MTGSAKVKDLLLGDGLKTSGSRLDLVRFFRPFDKAKGVFPIVTPRGAVPAEGTQTRRLLVLAGCTSAPDQYRTVAVAISSALDSAIDTLNAQVQAL